MKKLILTQSIFSKILLISLLVIMSKCYSIEYTYHYTTPLCLHLVKGEMVSFFTKAQSTTEEECYEAINDYIALWRKNTDSPSGVLNNLKYQLEHRISAIEYQLEHKNRFNYVDLAIGTALGAASIALLYVVYYYYKNEYVKNNQKYNELVDQLKSKGIEVYCSWFTKTITLEGPDSAYYTRYYGYDLAKYMNDNYKLSGLLAWGTGLSMVSGGLSFGGLYNGFYPDHDNQHLPKYKNLLQHIKDQIKAKNLSENY